MSDLDSQVLINGAYVHRSFVIVTIAWMVATVFIWPFTIVGCRRAYLSYIRSNKRLKDYPIYWAHIAINTTFLTIVAIDPASIFFDVSGTVNLVCLLELTIVNYSSVIYTFVGSVQHYIVQQKLTAPTWIDPFKRAFLYFNAIVGNIFLVTQVAVDQVNISGLTIIFLALEGAFIGPVFCALVLRLTNRLLDQFNTVASVESVNNDRRKDILKGIRKFRNFTYSSTALMYLLVLIVLAVYVERLPLPASRIHSNDVEFPDFARHRRFKDEFKLNWIMWVSFTTSSYFIWRHWIKKSSFAGKLTIGSSSKTKSIGSMDSTTSNGSRTDRYNSTETYSQSEPNSKQKSHNSKNHSKNSQVSIWSNPNDRYNRKSSAAASPQSSGWASPRKELSAQLDTHATRSNASTMTTPPPRPPTAPMPARRESRPSVVATNSPTAPMPPRRESRPSVVATNPSGWSNRQSVKALRGAVTTLPQHNSPLPQPPTQAPAGTYHAAAASSAPPPSNGPDRPRASSVPNHNVGAMAMASANGTNFPAEPPHNRATRYNVNTYSYMPRSPNMNGNHRRLSKHTDRTWTIQSQGGKFVQNQ